MYFNLCQEHTATECIRARHGLRGRTEGSGPWSRYGMKDL